MDDTMTRTRPSVSDDPLRSVASALAAGLAGTATMTLAQMIEQSVTGREDSQLPAKGVERATGVEPATGQGEKQLSTATHWLFGTSLGTGLLLVKGLDEPARTAAFFVGAWSLGMALSSFANPDEPVTEWTAAQFATDGLHHLVYATAATLAFRGIESALAAD